MKLGLKITAFVLSCFLFQGQGVNANTALSEADAKKKLEDTMISTRNMLEGAAGHDFTRFLSLVDGGDTAVNDSNPLESQTDLGKAPLIVVEVKDGKYQVIASRRGVSEVGLDLAGDPVHVAIVKELETKGFDREVAVYYKDKTGASFKVVAWGIGKLQEGQAPASRLQGRKVYGATEVEVISIPAGEVDVNAPAVAAAKH